MTQTATPHTPETLGNDLVAEDWERLTFRVHRSRLPLPGIFRAERERIWMTPGSISATRPRSRT